MSKNAPMKSTDGSRPGRWLAGLGVTAMLRDSSKWATLGRIIGHNYQRSQLTRMAAALSFRTLFGLIPVLVVSLVVLHSFLDDAALRGVVKSVLEFSGISKITVEAATNMPTKTVGGHDASLTFFGPPMPTEAAPAKGSAARLDELISQLLDRIGGINFGAVGLIGVVLLIYAALAMIVEVEKSFNQIVGDAAGKNWVRRVRDYWALLTLGPLLLVMSFGVREGAQNIAQRWAQASKEVAVDARTTAQPIITPNAEPTATSPAEKVSTGWRGVVVSGVAFLSTVLISALALVIVYTTIPNARIAVMPAVAGAFLAAILWETSKWAFTAYAGRSYSRLYGAIALLPLFMLWVYVTWIVVLLGFQVTSTLQAFRTVTRKDVQQSVLIALGLANDPDAGQRRVGVRIVDPAAVLLIMCVVAQRFVQGKVTTRGQVGRATGLPTDVVGELLGALVAMNLLLRVLPGAKEIVGQAVDAEDARDAGAPEGEAFALARPAEAIPAVEVLRAGDMLTARDGAKPAPVLDALAQAKVRALDGRSLADLGAMLRVGDGPTLVGASA